MTLNNEDQKVLADFIKSCDLIKRNEATYRDSYGMSLEKRDTGGINPYLASVIGIAVFGLGYVIGQGGK